MTAPDAICERLAEQRGEFGPFDNIPAFVAWLRRRRVTSCQHPTLGELIIVEVDTDGAPDPDCQQAADLIQQQQTTIERLSAEKVELEKQRLMLLAAVYKEAPRFVATICDEKLDRSGALLGQVRDLARAAIGKDEQP